MRLLLASTNAKKLAELGALLGALGLSLCAPADVGGLPDVDEDQPSFRANAAKKAISAARASGLWSLADDSGLEVDALGGAPGVRSARFAGEPADDQRNNQHLLELLKGVPEAQRGARFVCALALARPDGSLALEVQGEARGRILTGPRGERDFGYDPLFAFDEPHPDHRGRTFAELDRATKASISHRGRALEQLRRALPRLIPTSSTPAEAAIQTWTPS